LQSVNDDCIHHIARDGSTCSMLISVRFTYHGRKMEDSSHSRINPKTTTNEGKDEDGKGQRQERGQSYQSINSKPNNRHPQTPSHAITLISHTTAHHSFHWSSHTNTNLFVHHPLISIELSGVLNHNLRVLCKLRYD